uniref:Uncharacterized protein n=1 Tax=Eutreptiella gymnastica TaxID=73025 RepID=A0A7S1I7N5_9EUGL|mmetsp:Transcript_136705/g.237378  ORF Transcript_136705/g.237378 Transcript_136705/m.237378 type:complete len:116 (+) Transcript_136705:377-724(+)
MCLNLCLPCVLHNPTSGSTIQAKFLQLAIPSEGTWTIFTFCVEPKTDTQPTTTERTECCSVLDGPWSLAEYPISGAQSLLHEPAVAEISKQAGMKTVTVTGCYIWYACARDCLLQ